MGIGTIWTYRDIIKREQGLEAAIEFEQVVKKYQAEQIGFERERIIKLLEHMPRTDDDRTVDAPTLIALIKAEN